MAVILPRRKFLIGLTAVMAAPMVIKYSNLMPVKTMPVETALERLWREIKEEGHFASYNDLAFHVSFDSRGYMFSPAVTFNRNGVLVPCK